MKRNMDFRSFCGLFFGLWICLSTNLSIRALDFLLSKKDTKLFPTHIERRQERVESLSTLIEKLEHYRDTVREEDVRNAFGVFLDRLRELKNSL